MKNDDEIRLYTRYLEKKQKLENVLAMDRSYVVGGKVLNVEDLAAIIAFREENGYMKTRSAGREDPFSAD